MCVIGASTGLCALYSFSPSSPILAALRSYKTGLRNLDVCVKDPTSLPCPWLGDSVQRHGTLVSQAFHCPLLTDSGTCLCQDVHILTWSLLEGTTGVFPLRPSFNVLIILECVISWDGAHSLSLSFLFDWPPQAQVVSHLEQ